MVNRILDHSVSAVA